MERENGIWFRKGLKNGLPICLGYLAVSFTLGIAARNAGLTPVQAAATSALVNASAGEYAAFTTIAAGASYLELAVMILVANARYFLMSAALSQKLDPKGAFWHRLLVGFYITDEVFGVTVSVLGYLNPFYTYGLMMIALPGWVAGTYLGVLMGNLLPAALVRALSVGLYGMFLAVIIPPARKKRLLAGVVAVSMGCSYLLSRVTALTTGMRTIILTVAIAGAAAVLFPVSEGEEEGSHDA